MSGDTCRVRRLGIRLQPRFAGRRRRKWAPIFSCSSLMSPPPYFALAPFFCFVASFQRVASLSQFAIGDGNRRSTFAFDNQPFKRGSNRRVGEQRRAFARVARSAFYARAQKFASFYERRRFAATRRRRADVRTMSAGSVIDGLSELERRARKTRTSGENRERRCRQLRRVQNARALTKKRRRLSEFFRSSCAFFWPPPTVPVGKGANELLRPAAIALVDDIEQHARAFHGVKVL